MGRRRGKGVEVLEVMGGVGFGGGDEVEGGLGGGEHCGERDEGFV